jgi:hypothetical protein
MGVAVASSRRLVPAAGVSKGGMGRSRGQKPVVLLVKRE